MRPEPSTGSYDPLKEQKEFFGQNTPSTPTRSKSVQKYLDEIEAAVNSKDMNTAAKLERIAKLQLLFTDKDVGSVKKGTVTVVEAADIVEPALEKAKLAIKSAGEVDSW